MKTHLPLATILTLTIPILPPSAAGVLAASSPHRQADQALLLQAFRSLEQELTAALQEYGTALADARARNLPPETWPKVPTADFFPRFEELALQDQPDALRWCLGTVRMLELPMESTNARKEAFYRRLVRSHPNAPWILEVVQSLQSEGPPAGVGIDTVVSLLDSLLRESQVAGVPPAALLAKARLLQKSEDPEHERLLEKTLEELLARFPQAKEAGRARGMLFQLQRLAIGKTAPDFTTQDVDGVEFRLSDYLGKVVVLDFWGLWCSDCVRTIPHKKDLVTRLEGKPFALIGITTDRNKEGFNSVRKEGSVTWRNSWQGSRAGPLVQEWGVTEYPTVLVLDAKGVVRYRNVSGEALSAAVDVLLGEVERKSGGKPDETNQVGEKPGGSGG
jgi:thiol-disulfide isomerase/thioredoxin